MPAVPYSNAAIIRKNTVIFHHSFVEVQKYVIQERSYVQVHAEQENSSDKCLHSRIGKINLFLFSDKKFVNL